MKNIKSHFRFNKRERSGIFFLLLIIVFLQIAYFALNTFSVHDASRKFSIDKETQAQIEILKEKALQKDSVKIYPFNPNFITDYKGYALGMTVDEIDRLHAFRKQNKFANTQEEFQKVTGISDSLLEVISPYFKFPEWTQKKSKRSAVASKQHGKAFKSVNSPPMTGSGEADLNTATAEDLKKISGIGEKLSARIIKFRNSLGGFAVDEQLFEVYGLKPEVAKRALERFKVRSKPQVRAVNINSATEEELAKIAHISFETAQNIVEYRNKNGHFKSLDELKKVVGFPSDKIDRIALYLSF